MPRKPPKVKVSNGCIKFLGYAVLFVIASIAIGLFSRYGGRGKEFGPASPDAFWAGPVVATFICLVIWIFRRRA
jgi:hypothetical protein